MPAELWIDADDTLWENNIFFERAFDEFAVFLDHSRLTPTQVRAELDRIEHVNNRIHGYGSANFARNLEQCFEALSERGVSTQDRLRIRSLGAELENHPMELIDGVEETLAYLAARYRLLLVTKGNPAEQTRKFERSGLGRHFASARVVREKNVAAYQGLLAERAIDPARSWMVGNSPKSDINPALEAGLGAVFVPHPHTWHLEHAEVPNDHSRLLVLGRFPDLKNHF